VRATVFAVRRRVTDRHTALRDLRWQRFSRRGFVAVTTLHYGGLEIFQPSPILNGRQIFGVSE